MTYHDMSTPKIDPTTGSVQGEEYIEYHHHAYFYWLLGPRVALSSEYLFDHYERNPGQMDIDVSRPYKLRTHSLPITVAYFCPFGLYVKVTGTYINQRLEQFASVDEPAVTKKDDFALIDVNIGYRIPKRYGEITLSVTNLFDKEFNFQDTNFLTANEQDPRIKPERQLFLRLELKF